MFLIQQILFFFFARKIVFFLLSWFVVITSINIAKICTQRSLGQIVSKTQGV